jgi:glutamate synthase (NADPH/NADH) large chain
VGDNFAAGMTGGMAFVYSPGETFNHLVNSETVVYQRLNSHHWESIVKGLIVTHQKETGSSHSDLILRDWERSRRGFWQVVPNELLDRLEFPLTESLVAKAPQRKGAKSALKAETSGDLAGFGKD